MAAIQRFPERAATSPGAEQENSSLKREIERMEALVEQQLAATQEAAPRESGATAFRNPRSQPAPAAPAPDAADTVVRDSISETADLVRQPPWHVRQRRTLLAAAVLVVAGLSYVGYRAWQVRVSALDRSAATDSKPVAVPAVAPKVAPKPPVVPPPAAVVRTEPTAEPVAAGLAAVRRGGTPTVTHTRREPPPVAAAPVAAAPAAPVPDKPSNCTEAIVALGLCTPERAVRK